MTARVWKLIICILITSLFFVFPSKAFAQVIINEFSSYTSNDWIELYNTSSNKVNLKNWNIADTASKKVYEFDSDTFIPADGYCVVDAGNRLNKAGDRIQLFNWETQKDCVSYGNGNNKFCGNSEKEDVKAPGDGQAAARQPNGIGDFRLASPTKAFSNDESIKPANEVICTSPTPEPSFTPKPTPDPTQSPTPSPEPTNTPRQTSTPAPQRASVITANTPRPSPTASSDVLGENSETTKSETPLYAYLFMGLGVGLIGMAAAPFAIKAYNNHKSVSFQQNEPHEKDNPLH